jgi:hypothetical protein
MSLSWFIPMCSLPYRPSGTYRDAVYQEALGEMPPLEASDLAPFTRFNSVYDLVVAYTAANDMMKLWFEHEGLLQLTDTRICDGVFKQESFDNRNYVSWSMENYDEPGPVRCEFEKDDSVIVVANSLPEFLARYFLEHGINSRLEDIPYQRTDLARATSLMPKFVKRFWSKAEVVLTPRELAYIRFLYESFGKRELATK